jgi:hypothetical protein
VAAPATSPEQAFRLRRFQGTNTIVDPTFIGNEFLVLTQNWVPNQTFRLSKKPGSRLYTRSGYGVERITGLGRYYLKDQRYLYWYGQRTTENGSDHLFRTVEDGAVTPVGTAYVEDQAYGRMIRYGDKLYVGNGIEPLRQIDIETGAEEILTPIGLITDAVLGPTPPVTDPAAERFPTGSYEIAWAIFNKTTKRYTKRSDALTLKVEANQAWTATAPATALAADETYRLFVAPNGWPIEYATAQGKEWAASEDRTLTSFDVTDDRVPVPNNVNRTGNIFTIYRGRVVFAGALDDPMAFCATGVILPGLEDDVFNQGAFFPAAARVPVGSRVTALGVVGATGAMDPRSPLVVFSATKTFLYSGDPFDPTDTSAVQVQLSDRVGCAAHDTVVPTELGLIFMGQDSVYLLGADGSPPQDIGWPIADQITNASGKGDCQAIYHKKFYKLAMPVPGGGTNVVQWWLDLRQGVGGTPSWWGPHVGPPVSAFATALQDPDEQDKGFAALDGSDVIFLHHQMNLYFDLVYDPTTAALASTPIMSNLRSGVFDAGEPFRAKVFTRLRAIARAAGTSNLEVTLFTDGGTVWPLDAMLMDGPQGAHWAGNLSGYPAARWSQAKWLKLGPLEIQTISPGSSTETRPRGLFCEILLRHLGAVDVQLRDFEILFIPTERKVRYLGEKVSV